MVLDRVTAASPPGLQLLDVGSAHGWFVAAAQDVGYDAEGIEPEESVAAGAVTATRIGFFPDVLDPGELFDVITFNDVLEHIPDPTAVVVACWEHLAPGGVLSLNIPSSSGVLYRVASRRGGALLDRLWQAGLPSPHLWYFDRSGLVRLCEAQGFELIDAGALPSMTWRGLWSRAHMDRNPSPRTVAGVVAGIAATPLLNRGGDIMHLLLRRPA